MLRAVEAGAQAALMAPTEVLARQHLRTLSHLTPVPGRLADRRRSRAARAPSCCANWPTASVQMVVGTHALFQDSVAYRDLAVAVIDEQHRFGVDQRLLLGGKGEKTDVLVMTATPIPRTLLLTQWGEMDVSRLTEKPRGRLPIRTTLHSLGTHAGRAGGRRPQAGRGRAGLLGVPAGGGERGTRRRRGRGTFRGAGGAVRHPRRPGARPADQPRCARRRWRISPPAACGCWWRPRWSRSASTCREASRHGDRARGTFRPGAVAPVARPGRPRRRGQLLPAAARGLGERDRPPPPDCCCATPRTASSSPTRISACAAAAICWARGRPARPGSGWPIR